MGLAMERIKSRKVQEEADRLSRGTSEIVFSPQVGFPAMSIWVRYQAHNKLIANINNNKNNKINVCKMTKKAFPPMGNLCLFCLRHLLLLALMAVFTGTCCTLRRFSERLLPVRFPPGGCRPVLLSAS